MEIPAEVRIEIRAWAKEHDVDLEITVLDRKNYARMREQLIDIGNPSYPGVNILRYDVVLPPFLKTTNARIYIRRARDLFDLSRDRARRERAWVMNYGPKPPWIEDWRQDPMAALITKISNEYTVLKRRQLN